MDGKGSTSALKALSSHASHDPSRQRDRYGSGPSSSSSGLRSLPSSSSRQQPQAPLQQQQQQQPFDLAPLGQALPPTAQHAQQWRTDFGAGAGQSAHASSAAGGSMEAQWTRTASAGRRQHAPQHQPHEHQWANGFAQHASQQQRPAQADPTFQQHHPGGFQPSPRGMGFVGGRPFVSPVPPRAAPSQAPAPSQTSAPTYAPPTPEITSSSLAQTASFLVSSTSDGAVDASTAAKLRSSDFMALMRDFADGRKDVLGEEVVAAHTRVSWADAHPQGLRTGAHDSAASPYNTLSDADLQAATAIPSSSMRWEEDMNDDQAQEAFLFYNGPPQPQRHQADGHVPDDAWAADQPAPAAYAFQRQVAGESVADGVLQQEAKVLRDPGDAQGWLDLGIKQQENEREQEAILALERSISIDPSLSEAYLTLAISHTNNSDPTATFRALESWVDHQSQSASGPYRGLLQRWEQQTGIGSVERDGLSTKARGEWLSGVLIEMVKTGVELGQRVDGDVQVALGVLFNTSGAFDQAQDCFRTALDVKPDDYQLLNRLGATLANGGKAGEAYDLYWRALELRPGFVRARFNLGISCINLQRYEEAAEHVLTALRLQHNDSASGGSTPSVGSATLWDTLRNACTFMRRPDLVDLCQARNLAGFDGIDFAEGGSWDGRA